MARLGAVANAMYVPTPPRVTAMIGALVRVAANGTARVLDPCAGEGTAVAALSGAWGMDAYGVELHAGRAKSAANLLGADRMLHGSYHQLSASDSSFQALYFNPPYDEGVTADGDRVRQETLFLRDCMRWLAPLGLLVAVLPNKILRDRQFASMLGRTFDRVAVYAFPTPEVKAYGQVAIVGRKRVVPICYGGSLDINVVGVLGDADAPVYGDYGITDPDPVALPTTAAPLTTFALHGPNPYDIAPAPDAGCYGLESWAVLTGAADVLAFTRPLVEPRPGHVAMLLAAGSLDGVEIAGQRLVRGQSAKITVDIKDPEAGVEIERERVISTFSTLDLTTGDVDTWRADADPNRTREWFTTNGAALITAVRTAHPPKFAASDVEDYDFGAIQAPGLLPGRTKRELLDAQRVAAAAISRCWHGHGQAVLCGEQGSGKTSMSVAALALSGFRKAVVICPTHLVKKWMREVDAILRARGSARTAAQVSEVDAFFADDGARVLILSKERAKLGARWRPAVNWRKRSIVVDVADAATKRRHYERYGVHSSMPVPTVKERRTFFVPTCPRCSTDVTDDEGGYASGAWLAKTKRSCTKCHESLWTATAISGKGTMRWPLAKYIAKRYSKRYALVIDECHQHAGGETDQGRATQTLCTHATRILAMTGTLYGGRASSIFYLLYRIDPEFRRLYKHSECAKFVAHHGLFETRYKTDESTSTYGYRRGKTGRISEIPGVHPAMINILLPYTVFVRIKDLGYTLPPLTEDIRVLDHDAQVLAATAEMERETRAALRENPQILGQFVMACLGYPDCPEHAERIAAIDTGGAETVIATAPAITGLWPKDIEVGKIAREEVGRGLKTLVFFTQTHKRSPIPRVKAYLESLGLRVAVLEASVDPSKREEWIKRLVDADQFDVLLTNGRLVETGLDLLFGTTIVQYSTEFNIRSLRQSTRRSWRLGQTLPVRVVYLAYKACMQNAALGLIARKMRAAETLDGDDLGGLSLSDEGGHNLLMDLAREAAARFGESQAA